LGAEKRNLGFLVPIDAKFKKGVKRGKQLLAEGTSGGGGQMRSQGAGELPGSPS